MHSLINENLVCLDLKSTNKQDLLSEMANILEKNQCITN